MKLAMLYVGSVLAGIISVIGFIVGIALLMIVVIIIRTLTGPQSQNYGQVGWDLMSLAHVPVLWLIPIAIVAVPFGLGFSWEFRRLRLRHRMPQ